MSKPIYYIKNGKLTFADKVIFEDLELYLYPREKVCLIGRNGCGKSSLMKVINGDYQIQEGEVFVHPTARIRYLNQDNKGTKASTVYELISEDLKDDSEQYKADIILDKLSINGNDLLSNLSGGQMRRAYLAKALVNEPEILLLDEPTNHLDIIAIEWLEEYIKSYPGAVICISHDRSFLTNVTNKLWWLDRGVLRKSDEGFGNFENWRAGILEYEESVLRKLNKKLDEENSWLNAGVTARRKRNQKRLADLLSLRETVAETNFHLNRAKQNFTSEQDSDIRKSKFIIEAVNINFGYDNKALIKDFSFRCKKGEVIGFIGPNGCGKSTIIKLLLKELTPESGNVKHGTGLDISYFDQYRSSLNPLHSLKQTLCPNGGDQVFLPNDKTMHVAGYLKSFMFDPKLLDAKVSTLSGGEGNRLLLAKTLINPGNLLVLDEPTNDLDMDSLEILIEILSEYQGTIIVVSHDRDFINRIVTKSIVFDADGKMTEVVGGYNDYLKHHPKISVKPSKAKAASSDKSSKRFVDSSEASKKKLSYKDQRLLEVIPSEISKLESLIKNIEIELEDVDLYSKNPVIFNKLTSDLEGYREKIDELTNQWLQIECNL